MQGRSKMLTVLVVVLSDCLFFLQENSHKYTFFNPENKVWADPFHCPIWIIHLSSSPSGRCRDFAKVIDQRKGIRFAWNLHHLIKPSQSRDVWTESTKPEGQECLDSIDSHSSDWVSSRRVIEEWRHAHSRPEATPNWREAGLHTRPYRWVDCLLTCCESDMPLTCTEIPSHALKLILL